VTRSFQVSFLKKTPNFINTIWPDGVLLQFCACLDSNPLIGGFHENGVWKLHFCVCFCDFWRHRGSWVRIPAWTNIRATVVKKREISFTWVFRKISHAGVRTQDCRSWLLRISCGWWRCYSRKLGCGNVKGIDTPHASKQRCVCVAGWRESWGISRLLDLNIQIVNIFDFLLHPSINPAIWNFRTSKGCLKNSALLKNRIHDVRIVLLLNRLLEVSIKKTKSSRSERTYDFKQNIVHNNWWFGKQNMKA